MKIFRGHLDIVWCIALGPNGDVYSGSEDGEVRIWDQKGNCLKVNMKTFSSQEALS